MDQRYVANGDVSGEERTSEGLRAHIERAYELLGYAAAHSQPMPDEVTAAIATARLAVSCGHGIDRAEESRFWNAYSRLASNRMADQARCACRKWFYAALILLLLVQIYYLAGAMTVRQLEQVEGEWQGEVAANLDPSLLIQAAPSGAGTPNAGLSAKSAPQDTPAKGAPADASAKGALQDTSAGEEAEKWRKLRRIGISEANYYLGTNLVPLFKEMDLPPGFVGDYPAEKARFMANYMKLRAELELIILSLSGYILPLLYGALGAFAYVLRKLSDPCEKLTFADDTRAANSFRIMIGMIGGLAVGWFVNGNEPISGIGALSPLALAFAAGYASDLLFTMLDKVVSAFSGQGNGEAGLRRDIASLRAAVDEALQRRDVPPGRSRPHPAE